MTPFTLVMAYYENAGMLRHHLTRWGNLPPPLANNLHVVIVDDGSPTSPALAEIDFVPPQLASLQIWRMGVDVRWNQDACRNIGVREAPTPWVLLTDMDHAVPIDTWSYLMHSKHSKHRAYRFKRVNAPDASPYKPHPNSWALTRKTYWKAGGYDEALAGRYGTDGDFLVRMRRQCEVDEMPVPLIRYPREVIPDASTTSLTRKSDEDKQAVNRIVKARGDQFEWRPLHFSFPCTRVL